MTVQRYFQRRAIKFDALYDEGRWLHLWNKLLRRGMFERVRLTVDELQKLESFTVLDVGSGSGRNCVLFVEAGATKVVGIDFSQPMVELARSFTRRQGVDSVCEFVQADFSDYPMAEKFDAVVALGVFDYVADPAAMLGNMVKRARKKVIASFPGKSLVRAPLRKVRYALRGCPVYFYHRRQLHQICKQAGFVKYRVIPYPSTGFLVVGYVESSSGSNE